MADYTTKISDDHGTWTQELADVPTDLTTVSGVSIYVTAPDGTAAVTDAAATVVDADTVSYQFAETDLSQSGGHDAEFHVTYADGTLEISPENGYYEVLVDDDLI